MVAAVRRVGAAHRPRVRRQCQRRRPSAALGRPQPPADPLDRRQRHLRPLVRRRVRPARPTATGSTPTATRARRQPELKGSTDAWHQLGNDHIVAPRTRAGYVQLWSQDRSYEWVNLLRAGGAASTPAATATCARRRACDQHALRRPPGRRAHAPRLRHRLLRQAARRCPAISIGERVYAPFGDDPLLLHDVTIHNTLAPPAAGELDRVLGREPAQRRQQPLHRARASGLRPAPAHVVGPRSCRTPSTSAR